MGYGLHPCVRRGDGRGRLPGRLSPWRGWILWSQYWLRLCRAVSSVALCEKLLRGVGDTGSQTENAATTLTHTSLISTVYDPGGGMSILAHVWCGRRHAHARALPRAILFRPCGAAETQFWLRLCPAVSTCGHPWTSFPRLQYRKKAPTPAPASLRRSPAWPYNTSTVPPSRATLSTRRSSTFSSAFAWLPKSAAKSA